MVPAWSKQFGMRGPIHARLFTAAKSAAPVKRCGTIDTSTPAIEGEIALQIGADGSITAAFPVIELPPVRVQERPVRRSLNSSPITGSMRAPLYRAISKKKAAEEDWANAHTLSVAINGATVVDAGSLWAMAGGAAEAIDWLRGDLDRFGEALKPGDLVLAEAPRSACIPCTSAIMWSFSVDGPQLRRLPIWNRAEKRC